MSCRLFADNQVMEACLENTCVSYVPRILGASYKMHPEIAAPSMSEWIKWPICQRCVNNVEELEESK